MKKILVVVDMQADFVNGSLGTKEALEIVPAVEAKICQCLKEGTEIIFTRDAHEPNYLDTSEGKHLPVKHCIKGTAGFEIIPELASYAVHVLDKPSFGSVELAGYIRDNGFEEVELAGLCTDICIVSNALLIKAFHPEAEVRVDASCCAGVTVETHKAALETMRMCQVEITGA